MNDTLKDLRTYLRYRLNDADSGNYTDAELLQCINTAIADTELVTKCHIDTLAVTSSGQIESIAETPIAAGTGYSAGDILTLATGTGGTVEVIQVSAGTVIRVKLLTRGSGYTAATTYATTASPSAGRSGCTVRVNVVRAAMVSGTATYDYGPIFELIEASLHWTTTGGTPVTTDAPLDRKVLKDLQADPDERLGDLGRTRAGGLPPTVIGRWEGVPASRQSYQDGENDGFGRRVLFEHNHVPPSNTKRLVGTLDLLFRNRRTGHSIFNAGWKMAGHIAPPTKRHFLGIVLGCLSSCRGQGGAGSPHPGKSPLCGGSGVSRRKFPGRLWMTDDEAGVPCWAPLAPRL